MKSELVAEPPAKETYPVLKLRPETQLIVLFKRRCTGTVVSRGNTSYLLGDVLNTWAEHEYKTLPPTSKVILSNED
jgi:hypothetical protein